MTCIPKTTTHVWTPGVYNPKIHGILGVFHRLGFFKKKQGDWWVFSDITGWRKSQNTPEWFVEEKKQQYFITVEKFTKPGFIPKEEKE